PSAAATKRPATAAAAGAAAKAPMSMGKRLLIGAAAALGFMALANMLGLGEGFAQMLMILTLILLAVVAFRFFAARKSGASAAASAGAPAAQPAQDADFGQSRSEAAVREQPAFNPAQTVRPGSAMDQFSDEPAAASESTYGAPADFNQEEFLNMSTAYFKMLQKAWDSGDMDDLANYTTDDLFIELTHKRREIKGANLTEIVTLKASLAGFETTPTEYVASVLFTGSLKENGEPTEIKEIWNLVKPKEGKTGWLLAGIEQA
ncbi:TIM44-like domain-containing protein, partial [uncultured Parasutterella sp.]